MLRQRMGKQLGRYMALGGIDGMCFAFQRSFREALGRSGKRPGAKSCFRKDLVEQILKDDPRLRTKTFEAGQRLSNGHICSKRTRVWWRVTRQTNRAEMRGRRKAERQATKLAAAPPIMSPSKRAWQRAQEPAQFPAETMIANEEVKAFRQALARNFAVAPVGPHPSREEQLAALAALDDVPKPPPA